MNTTAGLYDEVAAAHDAAYHDSPVQRGAVADLLVRLPAGVRVMDLGCGAGRPVMAALAAAGHEAHGYDVSPEMLALAAEHCPAAHLHLADLTDLPGPPGHGPVDADQQPTRLFDRPLPLTGWWASRLPHLADRTGSGDPSTCEPRRCDHLGATPSVRSSSSLARRRPTPSTSLPPPTPRTPP